MSEPDNALIPHTHALFLSLSQSNVGQLVHLHNVSIYSDFNHTNAAG